MDNENSVTLIVFTSEGREHLLAQMFPSFLANCSFRFQQVILAIDGRYKPGAVDLVNPDIVKQNYNRKGYISSITSALNDVKTPLFFWLEDDFIFNRTVPLQYMADVMKDNSWAGLFLSRVAPIPASYKVKHYFDDLWLLNYGFSVSPTLCNTDAVKAAFEALYEADKGAESRKLGFETFIDNYFVANNLKYAVLDPGTVSQVTHIGELESTAREYHMINSVDEQHSDINKSYMSGFGREGQLSIFNKVAMLGKLMLCSVVLGYKLFGNRKAYDFSFRIYLAYLRGFKY